MLAAPRVSTRVAHSGAADRQESPFRTEFIVVRSTNMQGSSDDTAAQLCRAAPHAVRVMVALKVN